MAYSSNQKSTGLDTLSSLDSSDLIIVGDISDSGRAKAITKANIFTGATFPDMTSGSVLFAGASGLLSQDNTNFNWNNTAKQLSIGGISPINGGDAQFPFSVLGNVNDFIAAAIQNTNTGDSASTDFSVSADNDNTTIIGHYTDMGIWGSGFSFSAVGQVKTISLNAGGTGYSVNDTLTISSGDSNAQATVLTVNGSGMILTILLTDNGTGYSTGNAIATTGGTGTNGKVNILSLIDNSIFSANDGYLYNSGGNLIIATDTLAKEIIFSVAGFGTTNEIGRFIATQFKVGKTGTTLGSIFFSGNISTGITLQGQAVGASKVLTLPAITGTVATTLPYGCRAYKSAAVQSIGAGATAIVTFDVESWDLSGEFTSNRYTATTAGKYKVNASVLFQAAEDAKTYYLGIYKNGSAATLNAVIGRTAADMSVSTSDVVDLAVNDYIEIEATNGGVGSKNISNGSFYTYVSIQRIL